MEVRRDGVPAAALAGGDCLEQVVHMQSHAGRSCLRLLTEHHARRGHGVGASRACLTAHAALHLIVIRALGCTAQLPTRAGGAGKVVGMHVPLRERTYALRRARGESVRSMHVTMRSPALEQSATRSKKLVMITAQAASERRGPFPFTSSQGGAAKPPPLFSAGSPLPHVSFPLLLHPYNKLVGWVEFNLCKRLVGLDVGSIRHGHQGRARSWSHDS